MAEKSQKLGRFSSFFYLKRETGCLVTGMHVRKTTFLEASRLEIETGLLEYLTLNNIIRS